MGNLVFRNCLLIDWFCPGPGGCRRFFFCLLFLEARTTVTGTPKLTKRQVHMKWRRERITTCNNPEFLNLNTNLKFSRWPTPKRHEGNPLNLLTQQRKNTLYTWEQDCSKYFSMHLFKEIRVFIGLCRHTRSFSVFLAISVLVCFTQ